MQTPVFVLVHSNLHFYLPQSLPGLNNAAAFHIQSLTVPAVVYTTYRDRGVMQRSALPASEDRPLSL